MRMLIAGCLIELGTILFGMMCIYRKTTRISVLMEFQKMLMIMKSRIAYGGSCLEEIFVTLSEMESGEIRVFYENVINSLQENNSVNFKTRWKELLKENSSKWCLTYEQEKELGKLGEYLGGMDRKEQVEQLQLQMELLQFRIQKEREGQASYQRFVLSFSALAGLMIVVLIL